MPGTRIGSLWVSKKQDSKAKLSGTIDVCGIPVRIAVFANTDEKKHEKAPQYHIVSYGVDMPKPQHGNDAPPPQDDDCPF